MVTLEKIFSSTCLCCFKQNKLLFIKKLVAIRSNHDLERISRLSEIVNHVCEDIRKKVKNQSLKRTSCFAKKWNLVKKFV